MHENVVALPAAFLQHPLFNFDAPHPINYGGIGVVIGHEFIHGFDDSGVNDWQKNKIFLLIGNILNKIIVVGIQFDKFGNKRNWLKKSVMKEFDNLKLCLIDQYSNYEIYGHKVFLFQRFFKTLLLMPFVDWWKFNSWRKYGW